MKRMIVMLVGALLALSLHAQLPQGFKYQAIARDAQGNELVNQSIMVRLSILSGGPTGTTVWQETHTPTTNAFGLYELVVGQGSGTGGGTEVAFADIDWSTGDHYLGIEVDFGTGYLDMGTIQLLPAPYALVAQDVVNNNDADADPGNEIQALSMKGDTILLSNGGYVVLPEEIKNHWVRSGEGVSASNIYNTSEIVITDNGRLGIGTGTPEGDLHISKPTVFSGVDFTGSGIDDLTVDYSGFNGSGNIEYIVEVSNTGPNPDLLRWSDDNGASWNLDIAMSESGVSLSNGILVAFASVDNHTYGDRWDFSVDQAQSDVLIVRNGKVGIGTNNPTERVTVEGVIETKDGVKFPDGSLQTSAAPKTSGKIYFDATSASTKSSEGDTLHHYVLPAGSCAEELQIIVRGSCTTYNEVYHSAARLVLLVNGLVVDNSSVNRVNEGKEFFFEDQITFFRYLDDNDVDFSADIDIVVYGQIYYTDNYSTATYFNMTLIGK